jgi:hypothetical protein
MTDEFENFDKTQWLVQQQEQARLQREYVLRTRDIDARTAWTQDQYALAEDRDAYAGWLEWSSKHNAELEAGWLAYCEPPVVETLPSPSDCCGS